LKSKASQALAIAVLWRAGRNVGFHSQYLGQAIPDDALEEATHHKQALIEAGYAAELVQWRADDLQGMCDELGRGRYDLVFNASSLPEVAFLEAAGVPICGSGVDLVALDKAARKKLWVFHGVSTAPFVVIDADSRASGHVVPISRIGEAWQPQPPLAFPIFVKPVCGRNSSGITDDSIVEDAASLARQAGLIIERIGQGALCESYLIGREVTVGVIGDPPQVLPPLEIEYNQARANTFEHKKDNEILHCPARISSEAMQRVRETALAAFHAVGARDFARVDMIVAGDGRPTVLELNTFPGLQILTGDEEHLHASYIGTMAMSIGWNRASVVRAIVEAARRRYADRLDPAGGGPKT